MKYLLLLFSFSLFSQFSYSWTNPSVGAQCPYGYRNESIQNYSGGNLTKAQCESKTPFTHPNLIYSNFVATHDSQVGPCSYAVVMKRDCAAPYTDSLDSPLDQVQGCYATGENGIATTECEMKTCDVTASDGTLQTLQVKKTRNCSNIGIGTDSNPESMCHSGEICDLTLSDGSGAFSCSLSGSGELHCIDPNTGNTVDPHNPPSGGDTGGGDTGGGDTGGDTGGGDTGGGDVPSSECLTGLPDDSNTLSFNECTGETIEPINPDPDGTRESNETQCGIGNHIENGVCVKDQQGCGYLDGLYSCFESGDNCGTYTDLEGNTVSGCFDPPPNIYDPDQPKQQPVIDPATGEPVLDPVTGDPVMEDSPSVNVDMTSTNKKLDELKQAALNNLNEQKKTTAALSTANNHLNAINNNAKAILKENVKTNSKLDEVNENLEGLTEEVTDNKDQQIKDDMNNQADTVLNDTFSSIESGLGDSVIVSAPESIKSNLETFVPSYTVCSGSIPLDFGIYQPEIQCERFEQFKTIFSWFLYALTFYSVFSIALKPTER